MLLLTTIDSGSHIELTESSSNTSPQTQTQVYDFRYDDTDTMMNELQEFYPYIEMLHVAKNPDKFKSSFPGGGLSGSHLQEEFSFGSPSIYLT